MIYIFETLDNEVFVWYNLTNLKRQARAMFNKNTVRKYIRFYGLVQAVGFRYTACHAARLYGATGWVKNEWDDSVSMEIQGTEQQIDSVIKALNRGTYIRIDRMETKSIPARLDENGFKVAY